MKRYIIVLCLLLLNSLPAQDIQSLLNETGNWGEREVMFNYPPGIRVKINFPSEEMILPNRESIVILYALPNGNSIEQTEGKLIDQDEDWHFDIQHIAAQVRYLRNKLNKNIIVVYLEAADKSFPKWSRDRSENNFHITSTLELFEYFRKLLGSYSPQFILSGHSGGGRFIFNLIDAVDIIPSDVKRICFIDSNYGYEDKHSSKLKEWLDEANNRLIVFAYNDVNVELDGKKIVTVEGGTWGRSMTMVKDLYDDILKEEDGEFLYFKNTNSSYILHKNGGNEILHTKQVELNGLIHSMLIGEEGEEKDYKYFGTRVYQNCIQSEITENYSLLIPPSISILSGKDFLLKIKDLPFGERENKIYYELSKGNIPSHLRDLKKVEYFFDTTKVTLYIMPDYLAIGNDSDFVRVPLSPLIAEKLAVQFDAVLPTKLMVDKIWAAADFKLNPVTFYPVGSENEKVTKFIEHNDSIEFNLAGRKGIIAGTKKDVIISDKLLDSVRTNNVIIYGWHRKDGKPIQSETNIHISSYVDYSHGIRFIKNVVEINGRKIKLEKALQDKELVKYLTYSQTPFKRVRYNYK